MIFGLFNKKPKLMSRNALRMSVSRHCNIQDFSPLDKVYKLVPSLSWLIRRTPIALPYVRDFNDCNHMACVMMAKTQSHCVGMAIVETENPLIDHCMNIVLLEDMKMYLYDPATRVLIDVKYKNIKRIWL